VAIGVLGVFMALQFLAIASYYLPKIRQQVVESAANPQPAPTQPGQPGQPRQPESTQQQPRTGPDQLLVQRINKLLADSDRAYRIGDYDTALKLIDQVIDTLPTDPSGLLRKARILEKAGRLPDAAGVYAFVASLPGVSPEIRAQAEKKIKMLDVQPAPPTGEPSESSPSEEAPSPSGSTVRDEIGLQPGSVLGIVDSRLRDGAPGTKVLRVAIKSRPGQTIDTRNMKLHVYFFEKDETGEILETNSKVAPQWISPPVNWADNEPELLDVTYNLPPKGSPEGREFAGYVVGIFYNNELQDTRADPGALARKFPLPLYLKQDKPENE